MVKLRLRRMGRKKMPIYKIVAADSRAPRDGRFIEALGTYNPNHNPIKLEVNEDRVFYWLKTGAQPTDTVKNLLSSKGLMLKLHLTKKGADEQKINDEFTKWSAMQEPKLQRATEKRLRRKEKKNKAGENAGPAPEPNTTPA
ncbi:MAG: 30S ribosomal protein S16 [Ignavibacteriae bacterium]|nr:MAG: 30S ribosomal protein S16 [Ignavibacteriota bacterium]